MSSSKTLDQRGYNGRAIVSFVLGGVVIAAVVIVDARRDPVFLTAVLELVVLTLMLGVLAKLHTRTGGSRQRGSSLAAWGIGMALVGAMLMLVLPTTIYCEWTVQAQTHNNLTQIGFALQEYHQEHGRFPPPVVYSPDGRRLYSWRVLILPYLEQKGLYDLFDRTAAWDSPHNGELLARRPSVYSILGATPDPSLTCAQVFIGEGTAFEGRRGTTLADFADGTSQTLLVVEASTPVPWTAPVDLPSVTDTPLPSIERVLKERYKDSAFSSPPGFNVLFADGRVHFIPKRNLTERRPYGAVHHAQWEGTDASELDY